MVFRPPAIPTNPSLGKRAVEEKVKSTMRQANMRGVNSVPVLQSKVPAGGVRWPGSVIDPAWLKDHQDVVKSMLHVAPDYWRDIALKGISTYLEENIGPAMVGVKSFPRGKTPDARQALNEYLDDLVQLLTDLNTGKTPWTTVGYETDVVGQVDIERDKVESVIGDALKTLLKEILEYTKIAITDADVDDTAIIRSVWENNIRDGEESHSDVTTEEIAEEVLTTMTDLDLIHELERRGLRVVRNAS